MTDGIQVDKNVLILGATPEADQAADELRSLGYTVARVSAEGQPLDGSCGVPCSECELVTLDGQVGGFTASFARGGERLGLSTSSVVLAVGNERYYPKDRYGLPRSDKAVTVSQLLSKLQLHKGSPADSIQGPILFVLDLGGETARETAAEAIEAAIYAKKALGTEVYVLYRDLKVDSPGLESLTRQMRDQGIIFSRYDSAEVAVDDESVSVEYHEGTISGGLLVLPEAVGPHPETERLAQLLGIHVGEDGYLQDVNIHQHRPGLTNRRGVFLAGRCHLDIDERGALADAKQAAANVDALLGTGTMWPEDVTAHVESTVCIRCLTCVRSCPHAAIEIVDYEQVTAARVLDLACQGCGACVSNCPVQAIDLVGQVMPAWIRGL